MEPLRISPSFFPPGRFERFALYGCHTRPMTPLSFGQRTFEYTLDQCVLLQKLVQREGSVEHGLLAWFNRQDPPATVEALLIVFLPMAQQMQKDPEWLTKHFAPHNIQTTITPIKP